MKKSGRNQSTQFQGFMVIKKIYGNQKYGVLAEGQTQSNGTQKQTDTNMPK